MAAAPTRRRPSQPVSSGRQAATAALRWTAASLLTIVYYIAWVMIVAAAVTIGFTLFSDGSPLEISGRWVSVVLLVPTDVFNFIVFPGQVRRLTGRDTFSGAVAAGTDGGSGERS
jgi:hypothetical protein